MRWIYPIDIEAWNGTGEDAHRIASQGRISETCPDGYTHDWKSVGTGSPASVVEQIISEKPLEVAPKRRGRPPKVK